MMIFSYPAKWTCIKWLNVFPSYNGYPGCLKAVIALKRPYVLIDFVENIGVIVEILVVAIVANFRFSRGESW